ncbi:bifunctional Ribosomal protein L17/Ribosomal protein L17 superfamily [Babesia duncani]|uniref:Bifunctional Ribosomal protein L17/Ribosomal protein L17 superfamily n=1 Tax=Babesia duncani TaxID=323732 RepID=A0AAD9PJR9_9APIC|nr:bifunctional Ribosomal protein L17/Ribosomal protein L17 superfamily [Babesia duncani]
MGFASTAKLVYSGQRTRIFRKFRGQPTKSFDWIKNHLDRLIRNGRIEVTLPKAKELQQYAEEIVFHAKKDTPESDLIVESMLRTPEARQMLYEKYVPLYTNRPFFFTRVVNQWRFRFRDAAPMAYLEYVDRSGELRPAKAVGFEKLKYIHSQMQESRRNFRKYYSFAKKNGLLDCEDKLIEDVSHLNYNADSEWHRTGPIESTIDTEWMKDPVKLQRLQRIQEIDTSSGVAKEVFEIPYKEPKVIPMPNNNPNINARFRRPRFNP